MKVKKIFNIDYDNLEFIPNDINKFVHEKCSVVYEKSISVEKIRATLSQNPHKYTRGKYLIDFFKCYCETIVNNYNNIPDIDLSRTGKAINLEFVNIAHVSRCPASFRDFINNTIVKHIKKFG